MARGALIVIEGVDRCGKSTQCQQLVDRLVRNNVKAELICFPDRTTSTGRIINEYLCRNVELPGEAIHLLFSANRWELEPAMKKRLHEGVTLIVDRYSFSGVAYSAAKKTSTCIEWFKNPESGLPKPDCVLYLEIGQKEIIGRAGFGDERYENSVFQKAVAKCFDNLKDETWRVIDASCKNIEELSTELYDLVIDVIEKSKESALKTLW